MEVGPHEETAERLERKMLSTLVFILIILYRAIGWVVEAGCLNEGQAGGLVLYRFYESRWYGIVEDCFLS